MRIAIDGRMGHESVGVGAYVRGIVHCLSLIDKRNEYFIILNPNRYAGFVPAHNNFHKVYTKITYSNYLQRDIWEQIYLPWELSRLKIDVYHGPNYTLPIVCKCKRVVTMHDMNMYILPKLQKPVSVRRVQLLIKLSAICSDKIITCSENSKQDIERILDVSHNKVQVIYNGFDKSLYKNIINHHNQNKLNFVLTKYGIKREFILHIGTIRPGKNILRLIEAYNNLSINIVDRYQLVLAGKIVRGDMEIHQKIKEFGLQKNIVITGFVKDNDLPLLMNSASLLVFPSLYEGFGIPPLEAMACGIPVIASNISSIPEVVGNAALLFDPYNVEEMAAAIYKVLTDKEFRNDLREKGFERINRFSWQDAARKVLAVYEEV